MRALQRAHAGRVSGRARISGDLSFRQARSDGPDARAVQGRGLRAFPRARAAAPLERVYARLRRAIEHDPEKREAVSRLREALACSRRADMFGERRRSGKHRAPRTTQSVMTIQGKVGALQRALHLIRFDVI